MASAIDVTKPSSTAPTTQSVRDNFQAAKSEIEALQANVTTLQTEMGDVSAALAAIIG